MKRKNRKPGRLAAAVLSLALVFAACDMVYVSDPDSKGSGGGRELTVRERDELEKNGRFLKLVNMPPNTQIPNVLSVSVANSAETVGKLNKDNTVLIFREADSCSVYLPLVYNDDTDFLETGYFFTAFTIHVDALTKYVVNVSDRFLVYFTDGRGQTDVGNLPSSPAVSASGGRELTENERDELETTGRFLKLVCMPYDTQVSNVFSVNVANSFSSVAKLDANKPVCIFKENDSSTSTVYIPLVYNDDSEFVETGSFYTAFAVHVDAVRKYVANLSDKILVGFADGRGTLDARNIPQDGPADLRYLTVFNLPPGFVSRGVSKVLVHNMYNTVASCRDYSLVEVFTSDGVTSVKIPLFYSNSDSVFTANGSFFVSFELYYDALSHYTVSPQDRLAVNFINGNAYLDIGNLEFETIPYLSITGLPLNVTKKHFSDVSVYNMTGSIAGCNNENNIIILKGSSYSTALIPLSYSGEDFFRDTGRFIVSFSINIDALTRIVFSLNDSLMLDFFEGNASFDLVSVLGLFSAELTDPYNSEAPVVKRNSSFELNGSIFNIKNDAEIKSLLPSSSCVLYVYAYRVDNDIFFEYSSEAPVFNNSKKGYYNGNKRALWKMIYLHNESPVRFLFKTPVHDSFPHFETSALSYNDYSQLISSKTAVKSVNGADNPPAETITLEPGVYAVELKGAGGGSGRNYNGTSPGGSGGLIREIITLNAKTSFTAFTGSSGGDAPATPVSGTFDIYTVKNEITWEEKETSSNQSATVFFTITNLIFKFAADNPNASASSLSIYKKHEDMSGGGGGGGGSASFLYSPDGYFAAAGGGGGASGGSYLTPGGGGGSGGSAGPGSGGGGSAGLSLTNSPFSFDKNLTNYSSPGGHGGTGGGLGGGKAGQPSGNGGGAEAFLPSINFLSGGVGAASYSVSDFDYSPFTSYLTYPPAGGQFSKSYRSGSYTYSSLYMDSLINSHIQENEVCTRITFYGNGGSGGNTSCFSFLSGSPNSWINTVDVGGRGADAPSLAPVLVGMTVYNPPSNINVDSLSYASSFTGSIKYPYIFDDDLIYIDFFLKSYSELLDSFLYDPYHFMLNKPKPGLPGSDGGNNRNSAKGGGSAGGSPGSVTVYKIY